MTQAVAAALVESSSLYLLVGKAPRFERQPFRRLENDFTAPHDFVAPSFAWDWSKLDVGARVTIVKKLDLTLEYAFHDIKASRKVKHDEALATLRLVY